MVSLHTRISLAEKLCNYRNEKLINLEKRQYLLRYWSDKGFNGTVVNQVLSSVQGGSLEILRTVPLSSL